MGAELFRAEGRTDKHDETNSRFSQFCERALNAALLFNTVYFNKNQEEERVCYLINYEWASKLNEYMGE